MQLITVNIDFVNSFTQLGYLLSTETNMSVLTYQSVCAMKFHPHFLWSQCEDNIKWVGTVTSLIEVHYFAFFLRNFA